jgi:D-alanyl-D-alanine carboxypeptidase
MVHTRAVRKLVLALLVACSRDRTVDADLTETVAAAVGKVPGTAILVERHGEIVFDRAYGEADLELAVPTTTDSVFEIGSISKQFGAAAILQLVEAGKLGLDDPLAKFLPDFPRAERIRVRDLLHHTSGIVDFEYEGTWPKTMASERTLPEMIATFRDLPPLYEPNTAWSYSSSNYVLLAAIIEQVTGIPTWLYLKVNVFDRAGLLQTRLCDADQLIPLRAKGYVETATGYAPAPAALLAPLALAGGICSTTHDLLRWQHALEEGRVVSSESYRVMTTPTLLADGTPTGYGLGLFVGSIAGHRVIGHSGGVPGFSAQLSHFVDDDVRIVTLVNARTAGPDLPLTRALLAIGDATPAPPPASLAPYAAVLAVPPGELHFEVADYEPLVYVGDDTFEAPNRMFRVEYRLAEHAFTVRMNELAFRGTLTDTARPRSPTSRTPR